MEWIEFMLEWEKQHKKRCDCNIYSSDWLCESNTHGHIWHLYNLCTGRICAQALYRWMAGGEELLACVCNGAGKISSHNTEIEYRHNRHEVYTLGRCARAACDELPEEANEWKRRGKKRQPIVIACWTHAEIFSAVLNLAAINFNLVRNKFIEMEFR